MIGLIIAVAVLTAAALGMGFECSVCRADLGYLWPRRCHRCDEPRRAEGDT